MERRAQFHKFDHSSFRNYLYTFWSRSRQKVNFITTPKISKMQKYNIRNFKVSCVLVYIHRKWGHDITIFIWLKEYISVVVDCFLSQTETLFFGIRFSFLNLKIRKSKLMVRVYTSIVTSENLILENLKKNFLSICIKFSNFSISSIKHFQNSNCLFVNIRVV